MPENLGLEGMSEKNKFDSGTAVGNSEKGPEEEIDLGGVNVGQDRLESAAKVARMRKIINTAQTQIAEREPKAKKEKKKGEFAMFFELWKETPKDCRMKLVMEFITNQAAFKRRYEEEIVYRENMDNRWKK